MFATRFERATCRLGGDRSIQLSYANACNFRLIYRLFSTSVSHSEGLISSNRFANFGERWIVAFVVPSASKKTGHCSFNKSDTSRTPDSISQKPKGGREPFPLGGGRSIQLSYANITSMPAAVLAADTVELLYIIFPLRGTESSSIMKRKHHVRTKPESCFRDLSTGEKI